MFCCRLKDFQACTSRSARDLIERLYAFFESKVDVPRIRVGSTQTVETLINEEALLLAKFLRDEKKTSIPTISN